jgi:hypothetical protein
MTTPTSWQVPVPSVLVASFYAPAWTLPRPAAVAYSQIPWISLASRTPAAAAALSG